MEAKLVIDQFEEEMKHCNPGVELDSKEITLRDKVTFKITVLPSGGNRRSKDQVFVCLYNKSDETVNVGGEMTIGNYKKEWVDETIKASDYGWLCELQKNEVKDLLKDGSLIVTAKMSVVGDTVMLGDDGRSRELETAGEIVSKHTAKIFESMTNTDFILTCEDEEIPCHKIFLSASSPVFAAMMESGRKEAEEGKVDLQCSLIVGRTCQIHLYWRGRRRYLGRKCRGIPHAWRHVWNGSIEDDSRGQNGQNPEHRKYASIL